MGRRGLPFAMKNDMNAQKLVGFHNYYERWSYEFRLYQLLKKLKQPFK
jgi:hypothetical protein